MNILVTATIAPLETSSRTLPEGHPFCAETGHKSPWLADFETDFYL